MDRLVVLALSASNRVRVANFEEATSDNELVAFHFRFQTRKTHPFFLEVTKEGTRPSFWPLLEPSRLDIPTSLAHAPSPRGEIATELPI